MNKRMRKTMIDAWLVMAHPMDRRPRYRRGMIDLSTIAGLLEHDHQLAAYCPTCSRWRVLPLAHLVANGKGSLRLPVKVRCVECGELGRVQVRPPVPTLDPKRGGYVSPY